MEAREKKILYYVTEGNDCPFREWFESLKNKRVQAQIDARLERAKNGNLGYCASIGDKLLEMKIDISPGFRVYFGQDDEDTLVVLLTGGDKSTQSKDIKKAHEYWADYRRRNGKH